MTPRERTEILRLYTELRLKREQERLADVRRCSRCKRPVDEQDLSPARVWCRSCENQRKRAQYAAKKTARAAVAEQQADAA